MIIEGITIHNVGAFKGRHTINLLPTNRDRPVILFGALNGSGKTTLLDSLQLGLYGKRAKSLLNFDRYDRHLFQLINRDVVTTEGAGIEIFFQLAEDGETRHYLIKRYWSGRENNIKESVDVEIDGKRNNTLSDNWSDEIDRILPPNLARLFFFDGEKIEALADPSKAAGIIRSGIYSLLGLELVDTLQDDLGVLRRNRSNEISQNRKDNEIETKAQRLGVIEAELKTLIEVTAPSQWDALKRAENAKEAAEEEFESAGGALFGARKDTEKAIVLAQTEADAIDEKIRDLAAGALPLLLLKPALEKLLSSGATEIAAKKAATSLATLEGLNHKIINWLKTRTEDGNLIAGMKAYLDQEKLKFEALAAGASKIGLPSVYLSTISSIISDEPDIRESLGRLIEARENTQNTLIDLNRKLVRTPDDGSIQAAIHKSSDARAIYSAEALRYKELESKIGMLRAERDELGSAMDQVIRAQSKFDRFSSYTLRVHSALDEFRKLTLAAHVGTLERHITDAFRALIRKNGFVNRITIDPSSFAAAIINADEQTIPAHQLSAGERQLLATAILWGLARAAGRQLPVVIDTPLGRLDGDHRKNLVEAYFPEASHQVVLFSTDEEIDEKLNKSLEPSISHRYLLEFSDKHQSTTIRSGYFWKVTS